MLISEHFLLADALDKEKFNVEVIVQCIRISKMPQTHHHALLLLGAVAGMFPVSSTWNSRVGSSLQVPNIGKSEEDIKLFYGEKLSERSKRQNVQVPCSLRAFCSILLENKSVLMLWSLIIYDFQWSALEMEEAFWQQPCLIFPLWSSSRALFLSPAFLYTREKTSSPIAHVFLQVPILYNTEKCSCSWW